MRRSTGTVLQDAPRKLALADTRTARHHQTAPADSFAVASRIQAPITVPNTPTGSMISRSSRTALHPRHVTVRPLFLRSTAVIEIYTMTGREPLPGMMPANDNLPPMFIIYPEIMKLDVGGIMMPIVPPSSYSCQLVWHR